MLASLRLCNFKCFAHQSIIFHPLTLLSGLNGSGKSSILQALLLLRQSFQSGFLFQRGLQLNGTYVQLGTSKDILYQWADTQKISFDIEFALPHPIRWQFSVLDTQSLRRDVLSVEIENNIDNIGSYSLFSNHFQYLQAERIGPRLSFPTSEYQVRELRSLGTKGEYTSHFLATFGDEEVSQEQLRHPLADSSKLRNQLEAWLGEICPGTRLHTQIHDEFEQTSLRYSFAGASYQSNPYRSTHVGFGLTYTLPVLVALLSAKPGSLVLIENPEAHLHPKGQRKLGYLLGITASTGIQIILETHSEQILSGVRLAIFANKIEKQDVVLYHFTRQEIQERLQVDVEKRLPTHLHSIDEGPHTSFDQWELEEAALLTSRVQESLLWGDRNLVETLKIPSDQTTWNAEDFIKYINLLLLAGSHNDAKILTAQAATRFPHHEEIQKKVNIFLPPTYRTQQPERPGELKINRQWLRDQQERYQGQWVALRDGSLIEQARSFDELEQKLKQNQLSVSDYFVTKVS